MLRKVAWLLALLVLLLPGRPAYGAPRDKAALKKIDEAINTNYLNMDFDTAEGLLLGTIRACEDKCSPEVLGKAWMYVGIVRGTGRNDLGGAQEAFQTAVEKDSNVALDTAIASDPVKQVFAKVKGGGGAPPPKKKEEEEPGATGGLTCAPTPTEVQTLRPFPMECESEVDGAAAKIFYKGFKTSWTSVAMTQNEGNWRGMIPCAVLADTGSLKYYVQLQDEDGKVVATFGSKGEPRSLDVASETTADPPTYPGEEPPKRCDPGTVAPGGGGGGGSGACGAWGAPCGEDNCCQEGLACVNGNCESPQCEKDEDCEGGGSCEDGHCEAPDKGGVGAKNWVSLAFAVDIATFSNDKSCVPGGDEDYTTCFYSTGDQVNGPLNALGPGKVGGGFALATMRVLASYERLFGPIGIEARLGFAFNGGQTPEGGSAFLPIHAEVRGKYWILGEKAFEKPGLRPWVHLGGGLAQIDVTVDTDIADCSAAATSACETATTLDQVYANGGVNNRVEATKALGKNFVAVGGGAMYAIGRNHGPVLNLNFMVPLPAVGFVIEPSLGYAVGF